MNTLGERASATCDWWTPLWVIRALGRFDLDPCGRVEHPTADEIIELPRNGLDEEWRGRVWLNPPYGKGMGMWLERMAEHGRGTALIFARTQTRQFQRALGQASSVLFLEGKLKFLRGGEPVGSPTTGSALLAYGALDEAWIKQAMLGRLLRGKIMTVR